MKKVFFILFILLSFQATAQESADPKHGKITVQKKGKLLAVIYDDVNFRLVCKDIYGNIVDTAITSFTLKFTVKGIAYAENTAGHTISRQNQQRLGRLDGVVVLMFSEIKAKEQDGKIISFPDFKAQTGTARESFEDN